MSQYEKNKNKNKKQNKKPQRCQNTYRHKFQYDMIEWQYIKHTRVVCYGKDALLQN